MVHQVGISPQIFHGINLPTLTESRAADSSILKPPLPSLTPLSTLIRPVVTYTALTLHPHTARLVSWSKRRARRLSSKFEQKREISQSASIVFCDISENSAANLLLVLYYKSYDGYTKLYLFYSYSELHLEDLVCDRLTLLQPPASPVRHIPWFNLPIKSSHSFLLRQQLSASLQQLRLHLVLEMQV